MKSIRLVGLLILGLSFFFVFAGDQQANDDQGLSSVPIDSDKGPLPFSPDSNDSFRDEQGYSQGENDENGDDDDSQEGLLQFVEDGDSGDLADYEQLLRKHSQGDMALALVPVVSQNDMNEFLKSGHTLWLNRTGLFLPVPMPVDSHGNPVGMDSHGSMANNSGNSGNITGNHAHKKPSRSQQTLLTNLKDFGIGFGLGYVKAHREVIVDRAAGLVASPEIVADMVKSPKKAWNSKNHIAEIVSAEKSDLRLRVEQAAGYLGDGLIEEYGPVVLNGIGKNVVHNPNIFKLAYKATPFLLFLYRHIHRP